MSRNILILTWLKFQEILDHKYGWSGWFLQKMALKYCLKGRFLAKNIFKEGSPYLLFWRETYPQTFPPGFLTICEYSSWEKTACYRPFKNWHLVRVCTEKTMDHQYRENVAINIYSNCVIRWEVRFGGSPNQSKKLYLIELSIILKIPEKCWLFLYLNFTRVLQFSSTFPRF